MNKNSRHTAILTVVALMFSFGGQPAKANPLGGGQIPQIPAFLPSMTDVPMTEKLPIDGEWVVNTIRKRIRIEGGRAYAVDPWVHLFVLKVEPLMVVIQDIKRTGPGQYSAQDLPLMGAWTAQIQPDGSLKVSVAGALGPANYSLIPVRMDDQQSFDLEKAGQYTPSMPSQPVYRPMPVQPAPATGDGQGQDLANCQSLDVDPATGNVVCMD